MFNFFILLYSFAGIIVVIFAGGIVYALGHTHTWEDGIFFLFKKAWASIVWLAQNAVKLISSFVAWLLRDDFAIHQRNTALILLPEEISTLIDLLNGRPYDFPTLDGCSVDSSDIYYLQISAYGLTHDYRSLTLDQIRQITRRVVSEFWRSTRGFVPPFYISNASENRLTVCVPLSTYGVETLKRHIEQAEAMRKMQRSEMPSAADQLKEDADIPNYSEDNEP